MCEYMVSENEMITTLSTISGRKIGTGREFATVRKKKSPNEVREYQIFVRVKS